MVSVILAVGITFDKGIIFCTGMIFLKIIVFAKGTTYVCLGRRLYLVRGVLAT